MGTKRHDCSGDTCNICKKSKYMLEWRKKNKPRISKYTEEYNRNYYTKNKDKIISQTTQYYQENKDAMNARKKEYFQENKDYFLALKKKYWRDNKHILTPKNKARYEDNSDRYNKNHYKNWKKPKYHSDPLYRLSECIGASLRGTFKYKTHKKINRTTYYTGCSNEFLKDYLNKLFLPGMTWDNFGSEWHVDHIVPKITFAEDDESQKRCWNYTNLRPLWAKDNLSKGSKTNYVSQAEIEVLMNFMEGKMDEDKIIIEGLYELAIKDVTELCMIKRFDEAEIVASKFMDNIEAKKLISDLREIVESTKI